MNFDRSIFIEKFTQEAQELVQRLNAVLIQLEKTSAPPNNEQIKTLLRDSHTLKGSSKIMRFDQISLLAHKMEDLLIKVQDGEIKFTASLLDLLFKTTDLVSQSIQAIRAGTPDKLDTADLVRILEQAAVGEEIASLPLPALSTERPDESPAPETRQAEMPDAEHLAPALAQIPQESIRVGVKRVDNAVRLVGEISVRQRRAEHSLASLKELQRIARVHAQRVQRAIQATPSSTLPPELPQEIRAETVQLVKGIESLFKETRDEVGTMDLVVSELYEEVLHMRMLPLSFVFDNFPRAVRDMAKYFQKQIELRISGEDTTLDRKIIEKLHIPLTHILRNCIDHGIEVPAERLANGKAETGVISITACQKSGHVKIDITDDGRGIPCEKLKQQAIKRGLLSEENAQTLSKADLIKLAFLPRLSTSDIITDISGRGVGMDIIKMHIERLKGGISLHSSEGKGTTYALTLPVTLTTLRCLIIAVQQKLFAVPISSVEETLQIFSQDIIQVVGHHAIRLRNQLLYIIDLADVLGLKKEAPASKDEHFVLVARGNGTRVGLIVDKILDEQDVVVKPLPGHMRKAKTIAGATISSHNTIMLILHLPEIIERVKHLTIPSEPVLPQKQEAPAPRILVVDDSLNTREIEKRILQMQGYQVELAPDGLEALEKLEQASYDLIITDIEMPRMDGFTLTEQIRKLPEYKMIPIVMVTSRERESDKRRGLQVGANAYITKSRFVQKTLLETVASLL